MLAHDTLMRPLQRRVFNIISTFENSRRVEYITVHEIVVQTRQATLTSRMVGSFCPESWSESVPK